MVADVGIIEIARHCNVTSLQIHSITDVGLIEIGYHLKRLQLLSINHVHCPVKITDNGISEIRRNLPNLVLLIDNKYH